MSRRSWLALAATTLGVAMMAAAVWAPQLGLDTNDAWGPSRRLLLLAGSMVAVAGWLGRLRGPVETVWRATAERGRRVARRVDEASGFTPWTGTISARWAASRPAGLLGALRDGWRKRWTALLGRSSLLARLFGTRPASVVSASWLAFAIVAISYLWFVSVGMWPHVPRTSHYYDLQAEAFLHGQNHLLLEPTAALLELPNPYDPQARTSISYLWDASLFDGRYYLYWGPVPALLMAPIEAITGLPIGDNMAVFFFSVGSLFVATRLITRLWVDRFQRVSGWVVVGSILTVGWANPAPWLLNSPWIYEAAIVGGQFFLLLGLNALYPLFSLGRIRKTDLVWAGIAFSLAVGTRAPLVVGVGVASAIALLRIWRQRGRSEGAPVAALAACLLGPLAVGALALGAYNQARFGSPFETGHRYQLTSLDLQEAQPSTLALANVPPNLYNNLINPTRRLPVFPYIKPNFGGFRMSVLRIPTPPGYYSRPIAGILVVAPFSLFALGVIGRVWRTWRRGAHSSSAGPEEEGISEDRASWLSGTLVAVAAAQLAVVLGYIVAAMRYQGDFMPTLLLASTFGFWAGLADRIERQGPATGYRALAILLMAWTVLAGLLLGITSAYARFEKLNPELFESLTRFFTL